MGERGRGSGCGREGEVVWEREWKREWAWEKEGEEREGETYQCLCVSISFLCLHVSNVRDDTEDVQCIAYLFFLLFFFRDPSACVLAAKEGGADFLTLLIASCVFVFYCYRYFSRFL